MTNLSGKSSLALIALVATVAAVVAGVLHFALTDPEEDLVPDSSQGAAHADLEDNLPRGGEKRARAGTVAEPDLGAKDEVTPDAGSGFVAGHVRFLSGAAPRWSAVNTVLADEAGVFRVGPLPAGRQTLRAVVDGYALPDDADGPATDERSSVRWPWGMAAEVSVDVVAGKTIEGVEIVVRPVPTLYAIVLVVDAAGQSVPVVPAIERGEFPTRKSDGAVVLAINGKTLQGLPLRLADARSVLFTDIEVRPELQTSRDAAATIVRLALRVPLDVVQAPSRTPRSGELPTVSVHAGGSAPLRRAEAVPGGERYLVDPTRPLYVETRYSGGSTFQRRVSREEIAAGRFELPASGEATVRLRLQRGPSSMPGFAAYLVVAPRSPASIGTPFLDGGKGTASLSMVPPGPAHVVLRCGGSVVNEWEIQVPESGELDLGTFAAPTATVVRGVVRLADGTAAEGAAVAAIVRGADPGDFDAVAEVSTAPDGSYTLSLLPGADVYLVACRAGSGAVVVPWRVPASEADAPTATAPDIRLGSEAAARVRYRPALVAEFVESLTVYLGKERIPFGGFSGSSSLPSRGRDSECVIDIAGLPEGIVTFQLSAADGTRGPREATATLVSGEITPVDLGR